jgi:hypothetical protein
MPRKVKCDTATLRLLARLGGAKNPKKPSTPFPLTGIRVRDLGKLQKKPGDLYDPQVIAIAAGMLGPMYQQLQQAERKGRHDRAEELRKDIKWIRDKYPGAL